ncbi:uncharacterized protein LOC106132083 [Amyelois transitella]|uniref:uncharacterized protein LOC106132083 n=1 Tax=Amyelois transitella TaxID=680683 RepID=UPI00298FE661|nr:uncharacterized protein LOC106132083 [Amyelois transitella]
MVNAYNILVLLANLVVLNCQEQNVLEQHTTHDTDSVNPSYSFSYGVSDSRTGDIKTVWEAKDGDTVKGHYSVLEPDGSMRTVEYSAGPNTGFQAKVNNDGVQPQPDVPIFESKAMRDYEQVFDFSEVPDEEERYVKVNKKRGNVLDGRIRDYVKRKRPQYPIDLEPSEYTHSYSIKHPYRDTDGAESESHMSMDPSCKTKKKNENPMYTSITDLDLKKYPSFASNSFKEDFEKYESQPSYDFDKLISSQKYGKGKFEDFGIKESKYTMPSIPDLPSFDKYYPEDLPSRPKKKYKPHKKPEILSDDLDDYILVPKKKYKNPLRVPDLDDYHSNDDDYERPHFDDDDRYHSIRGSGSAPKEIIRKVVKKKKPVINLLDMFDI